MEENVELKHRHVIVHCKMQFIVYMSEMVALKV